MYEVDLELIKRDINTAMVTTHWTLRRCEAHGKLKSIAADLAEILLDMKYAHERLLEL